MQIGRVTSLMLGTALAGCLLSCSTIAPLQSMRLTKNGGTDYVLTGNPNESDIGLALSELADHLKAATGAEFRTVTVGEAEKLSRRIVVGDNSLSRSILGEAIISSLKPQESLVTVKGQDVVLVGGSHRASLYAAYSFLENEVGCRWYAFHLDPLIPKHTSLIVRATTRREQPAFSHRYTGFNSLSDPRRNERFHLRNRMPDIEPLGKIDPGCHTLFYYVPPHEHNQDYSLWGHPPRSNLFETHPEFFSLNASGQRVDNLQLCFSNPELRKVLTSQIDAVISKSEHRHHGYIALEANDVPGKFCHCPECRKLEERYDNIGGPLYDYLFDLSSFLKREHPGVAVKILAYRKEQTEFPPKIGKLPENVIVHFAPIDDNFAAALDHPTNRETLENLKRWCEIAETVWVWYYANPFMVAGPPFVGMERAIDDLRTMRAIGVKGVTFQLTTGTTDQQRGLNFADLQGWLLTKLSYEPRQDAEGLIDEFRRHYYGEAAPLMKTYLPEMEAMVKDAEAASGFACVRDYEKGAPVSFGLWDDHNGKWGISREIQREEIKPDRYSVYRLGRASLSPQCRLWMTDAWVFTIPLEEAYVEGDPLIEWDIYASLKFAGPKYGSEEKGQANRISCDRVILVRARESTL